MSTLRKPRQELPLKQKSIRLAKDTSKSCPLWRATLIGLLLACVATISGCVSASSNLVKPQMVTVDASLMVEPNLTNEMLSVFSQ
ncbi:o-spanin [Escherichia phage Ebrios]|uniref:O-spanin n=1 Tax=Escherichia phage Ebrios TaxID=2099356 RepID=A0A2S2HFV6_9CAUD|nr:Rz-like spanin [Escherichia phage Ebrios]AWL54350.1 o-spanin [Escherichia phage Ebrios]